mgnify:CR=1 FL=1
MTGYVEVAPKVGEEITELPLEEDDTLLLSTLTSQFPHSIGLKYKTESNSYRQQWRSNTNGLWTHYLLPTGHRAPS